jgi:hypothetical protein
VGSKRKQITPDDWETINNQSLHYVERPGRPPLLVAQRVRLTRSGLAVESKRRASKSAKYSSRQSTLWVPIFVLLRSMRVRKRFDMDQVEHFIEQRLGENFIIEVTRRGLL